MILADKIIRMRKRNGWSQEELAEKMGVSRQAVSKWESAQTVPDLEKILQLGNLFGVTTDYLLKDELEEEEYDDGAEDTTLRCVTLTQANDFLAWRQTAAAIIAGGVLLCVTAVLPLLWLLALSQEPGSGVPESVAVGAGLCALLLMVTAAVALFIFCGMKNTPYAFLDQEIFRTEYGVWGMVRQRQKSYWNTYVICSILGVCLCVLSPVPLLMGALTQQELLVMKLLCLTILLAGMGAALLVLTGVRWASMQKLLQEGEYSPREKEHSHLIETIAAVYWMAAVAIYLGWSFATNRWDITWLVWPVAGILFGIIQPLCRMWAMKRN